jgi:threonine/homoserine/homoserine lactone efflux protein
LTTLQALVAFTAAAALLTVTPGLDTAMVLRAATAHGRRSGVLAALGICLGCLAWGAMVSLGLGALLIASPIAYLVLKWAGAAYLLWLGIGLILRPRRDFVSDSSIPRPNFFAHGLLTNLLNPKVGVFYVTFLPQFIPAGVEVATFSLLLAAIHSLLGLMWFALLIAATVPLAGVLRRPAVIATLDRLTGGIFVAFGAKLALGR